MSSFPDAVPERLKDYQRIVTDPPYNGRFYVINSPNEEVTFQVVFRDRKGNTQSLTVVVEEPLGDLQAPQKIQLSAYEKNLKACEIRGVQAKLRLVPVDGIIGPVTRNGISEFQTDAALGAHQPRPPGNTQGGYGLQKLETSCRTDREGLRRTTLPPNSAI